MLIHVFFVGSFYKITLLTKKNVNNAWSKLPESHLLFLTLTTSWQYWVELSFLHQVHYGLSFLLLHGKWCSESRTELHVMESSGTWS